MVPPADPDAYIDWTLLWREAEKMLSVLSSLALREDAEAHPLLHVITSYSIHYTKLYDLQRPSR